MNRKIALMSLIVLLAAMGFVIVNLMSGQSNEDVMTPPSQEANDSGSASVTGKIPANGEPSEQTLAKEGVEPTPGPPSRDQMDAEPAASGSDSAAARLEAALNSLTGKEADTPSAGASEQEAGPNTPSQTAALPSTKAAQEPAVAVPSPKPSPEPSPAPKPSPDPGTPVVKPQTAPAPSAMAETPKQTFTADAEEPKATPAPVSKPAAQKPAAKSSVASAAKGANTLSRVGIEQSGSGVLVRISAANPIGQYKYFTLKEPYRLVVDLQGGWKVAPSASSVAAKSPIKGVRIGKRPDALRVVFDLLPGDTNRAFGVTKSGKDLVVTVSGS